MSDKQSKTQGFQLKFRHVVVFLLISAVVLFICFRLSLKRRLNAEYARIRAQGYPVNARELDDFYSIPSDAKNGAEVVEDALIKKVTWSGDKADKLPVSGSVSFDTRTDILKGESLKLVAEYMEENREFLEMLYELRDYNYARYDTDLSRGFAATLEHLSPLKKAAETAMEESIYRTSIGETHNAIRSTETMFALGRTLSKEPTLISYLVKLAIDRMGAASLERTVNMCELDRKQLDRLNALVKSAKNSNVFSRAIAGERAFGMSAFRSQQDMVSVTGMPGPLYLLYAASGLKDKDELLYIDLVSMFLDASKKPFVQRNTAFRKAVRDTKNGVSVWNFGAYIIMPALSKVSDLSLEYLAQLDATKVGLAIEKYRLDKDRLPEKLADLTPTYLDEVPVDPFDGKPMKYLKKGDTNYVVYSIGKDGTDNGGTEPKGGALRSMYDVTFTVERP
ncbi:Bacterial type II secretion system protein G [Anaerohalosphaera lusitana]|uniref:Bacterial type II secretion system protein G n=1 Tax=Anaerohalosphaera lusitana TaxID=1936003 RepID=A0A1U9NL63_9BACT|nr:hypothetical protein [Anaerohalosphaera lusitana]AQT68468.1 Bacterial type II secretion system protein G [Anaerohalosphaera lusitana]